jgi:hypothetical protein
MSYWVFVAICLIFIVIGTLLALYAGHIGRWWGRLGFHLFKVAPRLNFMGQTREETERQFYDERPTRGYWLFWLWGMRIFGAIMALFSILILITIIAQS